MAKRPKITAPDPEAAYTAETRANFESELKKSAGQKPSLTVHEIRSRPGTAQVGIFTGTGKGLTICVHGTALRAIIAALTAVATKGGE